MGDNIRRYRGNNNPIGITVTHNGDTSLVGYTIVMKIKIGKGVVYELPGTITDSAAGKVKFYPTTESVASVGVGDYEILVNDGTYDVTYLKDDFEILQDVS